MPNGNQRGWLHGVKPVGAYTAREACWSKAFVIARMTGRHQAEVYRELIAADECSSDAQR